jgi:hypothetical protein
VKGRIFAGALIWLLLISALHAQLNVGWERLANLLAGRKELIVGFLPVT